jgi:hypothetical protein
MIRGMGSLPLLQKSNIGSCVMTRLRPSLLHGVLKLKPDLIRGNKQIVTIMRAFESIKKQTVR